MEERCFTCNAPGAEFACSRCRMVRFCCAECQRGGWRRHKPDCAKAAAPPSAGNAPASAAGRGAQAWDTKSSLGAAVLQAMRGGGKTKRPVRLAVYPNVGALQGEVEVCLPEGIDLQAVRATVARSVLCGADPARVRLFAVAGGAELADVEALQCEAERGGLVASEGQPLRSGACGLPREAHAAVAASATPRYEQALVGGKVLRISAGDPEMESLLRCSVPVVVTDSNILGQATDLWNFDYLDRCLSDVDNFFVLCAPPESRGRFGYYDLGEKKNPCGYQVSMSNERKEMRFPEFRRKVNEAGKKRRAGKRAPSYYLQNTLLHREEGESGAPKPVGGFGVTCAVKMANDIRDFEWDWLKQVMGGRDPQMCQFFCGTEGDFSPCHYDPQDNMFVQVRGYKRVLLFHPRHFGCLYPWPVHHPQDRQSRVDFDNPALSMFPKFKDLRGKGLEAVLGPGEALRIPPGWWHHIEMLPSPEGEVVSINFWYPPPRWFYGDLETGSISWDQPLFGVKKVLFQRCVEDLIRQVLGPAEIPDVLKACIGSQPPPHRFAAAVQAVVEFASTVFSDEGERHSFLTEVIEGRFEGLKKVRAKAVR